MRAGFVLALLAGVLLTPELAAQEPAARAGDLVRIEVAGHAARKIGTLIRLTPDTLILDADPIPRQQIKGLERSSGRKSRWLRGLAVGFGAGMAAGAIVGAAHPCLDGEFTQLWCAGFFGAIGAVAGAPIGALIGSRSHTERWRRVPLDRLSLSAGSTGFRLGFALPF